MKKLTAWLVSLILLATAIPTCFAEVTTAKSTAELEDLNITLEVPQGMYVFTKDTEAQSGDWLLAGYEDSTEKLQEFEEDGSGNVMAMELVPEDKSYNIAITRKYSDQTRESYNLNDISEEQLQELAESNSFEDEDNGVVSVCEIYEQSQIPFLKATLTGNSNGTPVYEICYATIVNGYSISIDLYSNAEISAEAQALLKDLVDSVKLTNIYEKPTQDELLLQTLVMAVPVLAIFLIAAIFILVLRIRNKRQERRKSELGDRLVAYRKKQSQKSAEADAKPPVCLFENTTFCSDIAVKQFCMFHFFHKNIIQNSIFMLLGIISAAMGLLYGDSWLMRLLLIALGVYMVVQPFLALERMKKTEIGVYQKSRTREAHYFFFEEDFRIAGIQSPSLYPYFQILSCYEADHYFYLYFTEERAYLVAKDGFTKGEMAEFRKFLKERTGKGCHIR